MFSPVVWFLLIVVILVAMVALRSALVVVHPQEVVLYEKLGKFQKVLQQGLHIIAPFINTIYRLDVRTQTLDVPPQEVITKDNSPTRVDAVIYIKVVDPIKAQYQVQDYRLATVKFAQTTLRAVIGNMELDEVFYNREAINAQLRDTIDKETDKWGVKVENVEIKEVDPVGPVKAAMEEQTAAERERRAAILRADGKKRAAILEAEGMKRARILQAEGRRQAAILEAEGERMAKILTAQGDAQKLRILALGAAVMDKRALTVLSLDTLARVANGKATKIIFPFEVSRLIESASEYIGKGREKVPEVKELSPEDLEKYIGTSEAVLGPIPTLEEFAEDRRKFDEEMEREEKDISNIIYKQSMKKKMEE
ncbi:MAG: SPFH/Band 7/PHB domain protein [Thermoplasmata archaeon]|nr:SPFH/Band 7/PHB domain protein [Thermoplasmata archaeon]